MEPSVTALSVYLLLIDAVVVLQVKSPHYTNSYAQSEYKRKACVRLGEERRHAKGRVKKNAGSELWRRKPRGYASRKRRAKVDIEEPHEEKFCGLESAHVRLQRRDAPPIDEETDHSRPTSRRITTDNDLTVEMAIYVDSEMWKRYEDKYQGDAETKLRDFVTAVFSNIQLLYKHPSMTYKMTFKIVHYEIFKSQPEPLAGYRHQDGDAQMYLDTFCMYQYELGSRTWDHSFLFTGYDLHRLSGTDNLVSGLARMGGVCDPYNSCVLVEGHDFTGSFVAAHEIGHSFSMIHDEPNCPDSYIMSLRLGPGKVAWSTCSMNQLGEFIDKLDDSGKNCLRSSSGNNYEALPLDLWHLPGQRYDGDEQCALVYGSEYRQFMPREDFSEGPCSMTWCGKANYSRVVTAHPALEGTYCGSNRYCLQGHCTSWTGTPEAEQPQPINGEWSAWSEFTCSPCICAPFTGGLAVVASNRSCTNPKPANGGSECYGAAVRGLVCQSQCAPSGDTVKQYVRRKCEMRRDLTGDSALTGDGAQLLRSQDRACKVFCHTRSLWTWYRFYGDLLPDGTPCGVNKFCVAGVCLRLRCDNASLVDDLDSCPPDRCGSATIIDQVRVFPTALVINTISSQPATNRSQWNTWSSCSVTCSRGTSARRRLCAADGKCKPGGYVQMKPCDRPACKNVTKVMVDKASWSAWSAWTACSSTCDNGTQARHRQCGPKSGCKGLADETRICRTNKSCPPAKRRESENAKPTTWGVWSSWSLCSVSCGVGTRSRTRICFTGCRSADKNSKEAQPCRQPSCAEWGAWGLWSECASDENTQTRIRNCYGYGTCNGWTLPKMSREERKC